MLFLAAGAPWYIPKRCLTIPSFFLRSRTLWREALKVRGGTILVQWRTVIGLKI